VTARIIISLDVELRWGMQDRLGDDFATYRANLEGERDAIPAMLELFGELDIRATWAFVGGIACESWDEYRSRAPAWPRYRDRRLAWNPAVYAKDPAGTLYFAPTLIERIRTTAGQELGSHTFSHVCMGEPGFVRSDAIADAAAMTALFQDRWGARATSFVFPRNQIAFPEVLADAGISVWRGNPTPFYWNANAATSRSPLRRALRLADALAPFGTRHYRRGEPDRASHFVRFALPEPLWRAHVRRLLADAKRLGGEHVLHLWWHPHNLGIDLSRRITRMRELLEALREHAPEGTRFSAMGDE